MSIFHQDIESGVRNSILHPNSPLVKEWMYNAISLIPSMRAHVEINKDIFEFQDAWANPVLIKSLGIRSYISYIRGIIGGYTITCKGEKGQFELYDDRFILGASSKISFIDVDNVHDIEVQAPILTVQNTDYVKNSDLTACEEVKCYDRLTYFENTTFAHGAGLSYYIDLLAVDNPLIYAISRDIHNSSPNTVRPSQYTYFGEAYRFDLHQLFGIPSDLGMIRIRFKCFSGDTYAVYCIHPTDQIREKNPKCISMDGYLIEYSKE